MTEHYQARTDQLGVLEQLVRGDVKIKKRNDLEKITKRMGLKKKIPRIPNFSLGIIIPSGGSKFVKNLRIISTSQTPSKKRGKI